MQNLTQDAHVSRLRDFSEIHIDEDVSNLIGEHENKLFYNCTFSNLSGVTLKNCVLDHSKFTARTPAEMLGFTVTLDCHSFAGAELSPEIFDLICLLLAKTSGNTEKRLALINHVVGKDNAYRVLKQLETLESNQCQLHR